MCCGVWLAFRSDVVAGFESLSFIPLPCVGLAFWFSEKDFGCFCFQRDKQQRSLNNKNVLRVFPKLNGWKNLNTPNVMCLSLSSGYMIMGV